MTRHLKSVSAIPMRIPLNRDILGLGEHRLQSLSTFHRAVKKLSHFEIENLLIDFWLVLNNFTYILPITVPDRNIQISSKWMKKSANPFRIRKYPSEGIGNAGKIDKKKFFGKNPQLGNAYRTPRHLSTTFPGAILDFGEKVAKKKKRSQEST